MRIHVKVYVDAEKDQECAGQKPDFFISSFSVDGAIEELGDLERAIQNKQLGIKEKVDMKAEMDDDSDEEF